MGSKRRIGAWLGVILLFGAALPLQGHAEVQATLDWHQRTALGTPVSGTVARVPVEPGATAAEGDLLIELDRRRFEAQVARAESRVAHWEERERRTRRDWERAEELYARGVLADQELERAQAEHVGAESNLKGARAELTLAEIDRDYATVQAPFPARVLDVLVRPGQTVVSELQSEPLVVVVDLHRMVARAVLPWEGVEPLEQGGAASVAVGDRMFEGRITRVALDATAELADGEPGYPVEVVFDYPPELRLRSGQPATVEFE